LVKFFLVKEAVKQPMTDMVLRPGFEP